MKYPEGNGAPCGHRVIIVDQLVAHITEVLQPYTHTECVCVSVYAQINVFVIYLNSHACAYLTITAN